MRQGVGRAATVGRTEQDEKQGQYLSWPGGDWIGTHGVGATCLPQGQGCSLNTIQLRNMKDYSGIYIQICQNQLSLRIYPGADKNNMDPYQFF